MRYFYSETIAPSGEVQGLSRSEQDHLFVTLRARVGDEIGLLDGQGGHASAVVEAGKVVRVMERFQESMPNRRVHLFCAAPRRKEFDQLLKQAVEVGVWSVHLLACERSVAVPDGGAKERWHQLALEACKQSHNYFVPEVHSVVSLREAVASINAWGWNGIFGAVQGQAGMAKADVGDWALFIGPEGGFTEAEEQFMSENGVTPYRFGRHVMRLETAAICGLAMLNLPEEEL